MKKIPFFTLAHIILLFSDGTKCEEDPKNMITSIIYYNPLQVDSIGFFLYELQPLLCKSDVFDFIDFLSFPQSVYGQEAYACSICGTTNCPNPNCLIINSHKIWNGVLFSTTPQMVIESGQNFAFTISFLKRSLDQENFNFKQYIDSSGFDSGLSNRILQTIRNRLFIDNRNSNLYANSSYYTFSTTDTKGKSNLKLIFYETDPRTNTLIRSCYEPANTLYKLKSIDKNQRKYIVENLDPDLKSKQYRNCDVPNSNRTINLEMILKQKIRRLNNGTLGWKRSFNHFPLCQSTGTISGKSIAKKRTHTTLVPFEIEKSTVRFGTQSVCGSSSFLKAASSLSILQRLPLVPPQMTQPYFSFRDQISKLVLPKICQSPKEPNSSTIKPKKTTIMEVRPKQTISKPPSNKMITAVIQYNPLDVASIGFFLYEIQRFLCESNVFDLIKFIPKFYCPSDKCPKDQLSTIHKLLNRLFQQDPVSQIRYNFAFLTSFLQNALNWNRFNLIEYLWMSTIENQLTNSTRQAIDQYLNDSSHNFKSQNTTEYNFVIGNSTTLYLVDENGKKTCYKPHQQFYKLKFNKRKQRYYIEDLYSGMKQKKYQNCNQIIRRSEPEVDLGILLNRTIGGTLRYNQYNKLPTCLYYKSDVNLKNVSTTTIRTNLQKETTILNVPTNNSEPTSTTVAVVPLPTNDTGLDILRVFGVIFGGLFGLFLCGLSVFSYFGTLLSSVVRLPLSVPSDIEPSIDQLPLPTVVPPRQRYSLSLTDPVTGNQPISTTIWSAEQSTISQVLTSSRSTKRSDYKKTTETPKSTTTFKNGTANGNTTYKISIEYDSMEFTSYALMTRDIYPSLLENFNRIKGNFHLELKVNLVKSCVKKDTIDFVCQMNRAHQRILNVFQAENQLRKFDIISSLMWNILQSKNCPNLAFCLKYTMETNHIGKNVLHDIFHYIQHYYTNLSQPEPVHFLSLIHKNKETNEFPRIKISTSDDQIENCYKPLNLQFSLLHLMGIGDRLVFDYDRNLRMTHHWQYCNNSMISERNLNELLISMKLQSKNGSKSLNPKDHSNSSDEEWNLGKILNKLYGIYRKVNRAVRIFRQIRDSIISNDFYDQFLLLNQVNVPMS